MLLNQDQDLLANLSIAICSSSKSVWSKIVFLSPFLFHRQAGSAIEPRQSLNLFEIRQAGSAILRHKHYQVNEGSPSIMPWVMEVMTDKDQKDPDDRGSKGESAPSTQEDNTFKLRCPCCNARISVQR